MPILISAQSAPHPQTLVVNGQAGKTTVVHVNGCFYVDVEASLKSQMASIRTIHPAR